MKYLVPFLFFMFFIFSCGGSSTQTNQPDTGTDTATDISDSGPGDVGNVDSVRTDIHVSNPALIAFEITDQDGKPITCANTGQVRLRVKMRDIKAVRFYDTDKMSVYFTISATDFHPDANDSEWKVIDIDLSDHFGLSDGKILISAWAFDPDKDEKIGDPLTASFIFDQTPPEVTDSRLSKVLVAASEKFTVSVTFSEPVHDVSLNDGIETIKKDSTGTAFDFEFTAPDNDAQLGFQLSAKDCAGNALQGINLDKMLVTVDATPPTLNNVLVAKGPFKKGDTVDITFNVSEKLENEPEFFIDTQKAACVKDADGYKCSITVSDGVSDGNHDMFVDMSDLVGNKAHVKVGTAAFDSTPPAITRTLIQPKIAKKGTKITVSLDVSESADLELKSSDGSFVFACNAMSHLKKQYECAYTVTDQATDGTYTLSATVTDPAGNIANIDVGAVRVFVSAPTITDIVIPQYLSSPSGQGSEEFTVKFHVSTDIATAKVTVGSSSFTHFTKAAANGGFDLVFEHLSLAPSEPGGNKDARIHVEDAAGNVADADAGAIIYDKIRPTLKSKTLDPATATTGTKVDLNLVFSEKVRDLAFQGLQFTCASTDQINFDCNYTILATDTQNNYHILIQAKDVAGNSMGASFLDIATLKIDREAPAISNVKVTPATVKAGDTITITFNTNEPAQKPGAKIGDEVVEDCKKDSDTAFTCTHVVKAIEAEGENTITITVEDIAGNKTTNDKAKVTYDFSAPKIVTEKLERTPALDSAVLGENDVVFSTTYPDHHESRKVKAIVTITADEDIKNSSPAPTLQAKSGANTISFNLTNHYPKQVVFSHQIALTDQQGVYEFYLTWQDEVGNKETKKLDNMTMRINTTPPDVSNVDLDKITAIRVPWGNVDTAGKPLLKVEGVKDAVNFDTAKEDIAYVEVNFPAGLTRPAATKVNNDGSFEIMDEIGFNKDLKTISLVIYDRSGLASDPVTLKKAVLVVTSGAGNQNPVNIARAPKFSVKKEILKTDISTDERAKTALSGDDFIDSATNEMEWKRIESGDPDLPGAQTNHCMRYDPISGRILLVADKKLFEYSSEHKAWHEDNFMEFREFGDQVTSVFDDMTNRLFVIGSGGSFSGQAKMVAYDLNDNTWISPYDNTLLSPPIGADNGRRAAIDEADREIALVSGKNMAFYDIDTNTWVTKAFVFAKNHHFSAFVCDEIDDFYFLFGGEGDGQYFDDTWLIDKNDWTVTPIRFDSASDHPSARTGMAFAKYGDQGFYIAGGRDSTNTVLKDTWFFDFNTEMWAKETDLPDARVNGSMTYDPENDRMVFYGGEGGLTDDKMFAYYPATKTWVKFSKSEVNDSDAPSKYSDFAIAYDEDKKEVVLFGGHLGNGFLSGIRVFDTTTGKWSGVSTTGGPSNFQRDGAAMCYSKFDKKIYVFGGHRYDSYDSNMYQLDPDTAIWTTLADTQIPPGRTMHSMVCTDDGHVVVIGGQDSDGNELNDTWRWSISTQTWSQTGAGTGMPDWRLPFAATTVGDKVYAFGRDNADDSASFAEYDVSTIKWSAITGTDFPHARENHAMQPYGTDGLLMFGGGFADGVITYFDDLWKYSIGSKTWADITPTGIGPKLSNVHNKTTVDTSTNDAFLYNTDGFDATGSFLWKLAKPVGDRPAIITTLDLSQVMPATSIFTGSYITVYAAGTSGATLYIWNFSKGMWEKLATNTAKSSSAMDTWKMAKVLLIRGYISNNNRGFIATVANEGYSSTAIHTYLDYAEIDITYNQQ